MGTVHMVCGPVGAGKTTFGRKLAEERGGVFFALDEWMQALFLPDAPRPFQLEWMLVRTRRCEGQIWDVCQRVLARGLPVIVEMGFYKREQRDRFRALAVDHAVQIYRVSADREVRRERVRARNFSMSDTFSIEVDDATFNWAEEYFEELQPDELQGAIEVRSGVSRPRP